MEAGGATVHDDFLRMFQEAGLENLATEVGILQNGEIPALRRLNYNPVPQNAKLEKISDSGSASGAAQKRKIDDPTAPKVKVEGEDYGNFGSHSTDGADGSNDSKAKKKRISRKTYNCNKGLRHSSMKVMRKVEEKGKTTYNEVADELVEEYTANKGLNAVDQAYEGKNIRRRVYDILNVLIAMDIISREKKEIRWRGLPSNAERDLAMLQRERKALFRNIDEKHEHLQQLLLQQVALKNLIKRNKETELKEVVEDNQKIPLPFIVINTNRNTLVECELKMDQTDIFFNFNNTFEIHDDNEVLKRMKLQAVPPEDMKEYIPEALLKYLPAHFKASAANVHDDNGGKNRNIHNENVANQNVPTILACNNKEAKSETTVSAADLNNNSSSNANANADPDATSISVDEAKK